MTYKTHMLGGLLAGLLVRKLGVVDGISSSTIVVVVSTFASLIPDIDIEGSKISNKAKTFSKAVTSFTSHRGIFHTPTLYIVIAILLKNIIPSSILIGFLAGVISHIVLDMFNSKGVPLFYPFINRKVSLAKIKTRGTGEMLFSAILIVMIVLLVFDKSVFASVKELAQNNEFDLKLKLDILNGNSKLDKLKILDNIKDIVINSYNKLKAVTILN